MSTSREPSEPPDPPVTPGQSAVPGPQDAGAVLAAHGIAAAPAELTALAARLAAAEADRRALDEAVARCAR